MVDDPNKLEINLHVDDDVSPLELDELTAAMRRELLQFDVDSVIVATSEYITTTAVVAIAENVLPALRLPGGAFYRAFGGNRWEAAAILGVVTAGIIGVGIEAAYFQYPFDQMLGFAWEVPIFAAFTFLVAEAAVGRRFRGNREQRSPAA